MRYEDLSQYDQALVNTDFGDLEKEAQEKLAEANEVYAYGQEQAHLIADQMDEAMAKFASEEEEEEEEEEELDEESEKKAAELGAFIERGMFDELTKLGSQRHGDAMYYYYPYMEEKVAQIGAEEKLAAWADIVAKARSLGSSAKGLGSSAKGKLKGVWDAAKEKTRAPREGFMDEMRKAKAGLKSDAQGLRSGEPSRSRVAGHLAGKAVAPLGAAGLTAGGIYGYNKLKKKKQR